MNKKSPVSTLMTKNVVVASLDSKLETVLEFFNTYKVQHLPVTFNNTLLGILSLNDVIDFFASQYLKGLASNFNELKNNFSIKEIMTENPTTVKETDSIETVIKILSTASYQSVLVTNEGNLVGIVTNKDLVKFLASL
ncbi:MAG: CBS domain-containing protein [Bacteroidetes bacterium]|jgi:CBS domain-containing protein|nr:CBS domain-containing protein [Bacteroidota bacterium]